MPSKYPAHNLTREEVDHCLMVLAAHGANAKRAREHLAETLGKDNVPSERTLRTWRNVKYVDRYHELAAGIDQASRDKRMTQGFREIVQQSQDSIASVLNRLSEESDQLDTKELAKTAQQLAVTAGIATEKTLLLEGRPTAILETRSPDWYEGKLAELVAGSEIQDAVVVEDDRPDVG